MLQLPPSLELLAGILEWTGCSPDGVRGQNPMSSNPVCVPRRVGAAHGIIWNPCIYVYIYMCIYIHSAAAHDTSRCLPITYQQAAHIPTTRACSHALTNSCLLQVTEKLVTHPRRSSCTTLIPSYTQHPSQHRRGDACSCRHCAATTSKLAEASSNMPWVAATRHVHVGQDRTAAATPTAPCGNDREHYGQAARHRPGATPFNTGHQPPTTAMHTCSSTPPPPFANTLTTWGGRAMTMLPATEGN